MRRATRLTYAEDFAVNPARRDAAQCNAVSVVSGRLKSLPEFAAVLSARNFVRFAGVTDAGVFLCNRNMLLLYTGEGNPVTIHRLSRPIMDMCAALRRNTLYTAYNSSGLWKTASNASARQTLNGFDSLCVSNERVVGLRGGRVMFSDADGELSDDEENYTYVDLPTVCQAVVALKDNAVYALGNVCYKLTLSADLSKITVSTVAEGLGLTYRDTVCVLNDSAVFATKSGVYRLKNDKITQIFQNFYKNAPDFANGRARVVEGRYALIVPAGDVLRAYVLDTDRQLCVAVLDGSVADLAYLNGKLYAIGTDMMFKSVAESVGNAKFVREGVDFGVGAVKHLRRLTVNTSSGANITIGNGKRAFTYRVRGGNEPQQVYVRGCGRAFSMQITPLGNSLDVTALTLEADIYREER